MINTVPDILTRIVEHKQHELQGTVLAVAEIEERASFTIAGRRDFAAALQLNTPAIIAEIKKASPSKGILAEHFDPGSIAAQYESGGAAALSVLTDQQFFQGSLEHLRTARERTALPVLRKDFTIDAYHVVEAAANGADAILLIAAILTERQLRDYRELATRYGLASLVEVHDEDELERAVASGAAIVGVNNRNLHTFEVTLDTSMRLTARIPAGVVRVSESGIHSQADVARLRDAGYQAFLVGEHLMRSGDPAGALRQLIA